MPEEKKRKVVISKSYERKVGLSAISSQYDNISLSSHASMEVEISSIDELRSKMNKLHKLVYEETEADIKSAFIELLKLSEDEDNLALTNNGQTLELPESEVEVEEEASEKKSETKKVEENVNVDLEDDWTPDEVDINEEQEDDEDDDYFD